MLVIKHSSKELTKLLKDETSKNHHELVDTKLATDIKYIQ